MCGGGNGSVCVCGGGVEVVGQQRGGIEADVDKMA